MATLPLGEYLWRRILEVGIETVMGLPGDFNLQLLDHIYSVKGLRWVGTGNELNASYAVDGYARIKGVPGCVVTTHGVGELSALNGIAGSLTEQIKVIHVVGQTPRPLQQQRLMIHHSIGFNPDHQIFSAASATLRKDQALLWELDSACNEIDRVIRECFVKNGPVNIFVPLDLVDQHVPADRLDTPIDISLPRTDQTPDLMEEAATAIFDAISQAEHPVVYVDALVSRHGAVKQLRSLVEQLRLPVFHSGIGVGLIDPKCELVVGAYNGDLSNPGINDEWDRSDLRLVFGRLPADTNTAGFSQDMPSEKTIDFRPTEVEIMGHRSFKPLYYKTFFPFLIDFLSKKDLPPRKIPRVPEWTISAGGEPRTKALTAAYLWPKFSSFLQKGDSVFADTGTSLFGLLDCTYPEDYTYNTQTYYGSIGWATPAAMGAELARQELGRGSSAHVDAPTTPQRTILVTGDGSIQLTVQEVGTMIKHGAKVVIVLINNNGYTIERAIHGAKQPYNDIAAYDWSKMLAFFGMSDDDARRSYARCTTEDEFDAVLSRIDFRRPERVMVLEVVLSAFDSPWRLTKVLSRKGEWAVKEMEEGGFVMRQAVATTD